MGCARWTQVISITSKYYQVQHQMVCAKRFWRDLVVCSAGTIFRERTTSNPRSGLLGLRRSSSFTWTPMSVSLFSQSIKFCRTVVIPYPSDIMTVSPFCTFLVHLLCISQRLPLGVCHGQLVVVLLVASQFVPTLE